MFCCSGEGGGQDSYAVFPPLVSWTLYSTHDTTHQLVSLYVYYYSMFPLAMQWLLFLACMSKVFQEHQLQLTVVAGVVSPHKDQRARGK